MTSKGEWSVDSRQPGPEDSGQGVDVPQLVQFDLHLGLQFRTPPQSLKALYSNLAGIALFLRAFGSGYEYALEPVGLTRLLMNDVNERAEMGKKKYGVRLHTNNGRDALLDAYQEILDAICYVRQAMEERGEKPVTL